MILFLLIPGTNRAQAPHARVSNSECRGVARLCLSPLALAPSVAMRSHLILSRNSVAPLPSRARATHAHSAPRASPPLHRTSTVVVLCCRLHSVPPPQGAVVEPISRVKLENGVTDSRRPASLLQYAAADAQPPAPTILGFLL